MVRRGSPRTFQQFHSLEFFQHNAVPIRQRAYRFQATFALATVPVAEYAQLACPITPNLWGLIMILSSWFSGSLFEAQPFLW
jgi:hypothetical protein